MIWLNMFNDLVYCLGCSENVQQVQHLEDGPNEPHIDGVQGQPIDLNNESNMYARMKRCPRVRVKRCAL